MVDDRSTTIEPVEAPLSHLGRDRSGTSRVDRRTAALGAAVVVLVIAIVMLWPEQPAPSRAANPGANESAGAASASTPSSTVADEGPAPFEASQRRLTRERAQASLARFVELQIELEDEMTVSAWGQAELDAALELAKAGDLAFTAERYEDSMARYEEAVVAIQAVRGAGDARFDTLIEQAQAALAQRDPTAADARLAEARTIKPESSELQQLTRRLETLPEVIKALRTAKNHELAGRFDQALATYESVAQLDPETQGLDALKAQVADAQREQTVARHLSNGFDALDAKRFGEARRAFNAALALDGNNQIALGGLQQVAKDNDLSVIERARRRGETALQDERWADAKAAYSEVLALDKNIRFASAGLRTAEAHEQSAKLLGAITSEPKRLSSQSLYLQAQEIVESARTLDYRGPELNGLLAETERLLGLYRDPVDVTLISDNATDIVMSNIGRLGFFTEKTVSLRPGEYTIRGSQAGCRDLYLSIEVLPGIAPLDLRCPERL